jgi:probable F420-dependent oxidoreductase
MELERLPCNVARETAREIESLGWPSLWIPEALGREALTTSALLLSATERLVVVTGIATIWGRDAVTAATAHRTLTEAFPERFVLGLGVSHEVLVSGARGHNYAKPLTAMSNYLDAMDACPYQSVAPTTPLRRLLAALQPRMLRLSARKADGAHPYLVTPEHTAAAREILGDGPILAPEQKVVLEKDPAEARRIARSYLAFYFSLPNYRNNLLALGFNDEDIEGQGSDRAVDALVAWGDEEAVAKRVQAHRDAGADHVCIQPLGDPAEGFPMDTVRRLSDAFLP